MQEIGTLNLFSCSSLIAKIVRCLHYVNNYHTTMVNSHKETGESHLALGDIT